MDATVICWTSLMLADASTVIRCTSRASSRDVYITWQRRAFQTRCQCDVARAKCRRLMPAHARTPEQVLFRVLISGSLHQRISYKRRSLVACIHVHISQVRQISRLRGEIKPAHDMLRPTPESCVPSCCHGHRTTDCVEFGRSISPTCISVSFGAGAATARISCTSFCQPRPRTETSYTGSPSGRANASTI